MNTTTDPALTVARTEVLFLERSNSSSRPRWAKISKAQIRSLNHFLFLPIRRGFGLSASSNIHSQNVLHLIRLYAFGMIAAERICPYSRPQPHYPPPPDTAQRPSDAPPSSMATSVTGNLPFIHDSRGYGPPHAEPRYASPNVINSYSPLGHQPPQYLLPLQPQSDPRSSAYPPPPPDQRGDNYDDRRLPYEQQPYDKDPYYAYCRGQPPQGPPPPNGYPGYPAGVYKYPLVRYGRAPLRRKRISIACNHCRKRKIRCSGRQGALGSKCQNCALMNQECIVQPVR
ncbi:hypothetical protein FPOA_12242 [Fusarium poae]|uniref:Zn(2)-C6 fungal-type domain-containing protein n=2 Tax=Fusarium poae TaxID=36050 RepID=A0A1B8A598_FUSPO|nr:hypothetical protein FPOA_13544 [Fusarium poae]OBS17199.1 hypothetical protein FPOA_12291 [Fusarium poae]OBS17212.1 hypothetical protein FPOA_12242 [Fusarium poae]